MWATLGLRCRWQDSSNVWAPLHLLCEFAVCCLIRICLWLKRTCHGVSVGEGTLTHTDEKTKFAIRWLMRMEWSRNADAHARTLCNECQRMPTNANECTAFYGTGYRHTFWKVLSRVGLFSECSRDWLLRIFCQYWPLETICGCLISPLVNSFYREHFL